MKSLIIPAILANLFGHATWISLLINLAFLLFKNAPLFSWWWVVACAVGFLVSLAVTFSSFFRNL